MLTELELWHASSNNNGNLSVTVCFLTTVTVVCLTLWRSRRCKRLGNVWYIQAGEQSNFNVDDGRQTSTVTRAWKHALAWQDLVLSVNKMLTLGLLYDSGPDSQSNYVKCWLNGNFDRHLATIMVFYQLVSVSTHPESRINGLPQTLVDRRM